VVHFIRLAESPRAFSTGQTAAGFLLLVRSQLRLSPELRTTSLGGIEAVPCALDDTLPLINL
jgi:hypothetical protein